ncbi:MAG: hypothetical protein WKG00_20305 [Polyangiaceae bacterium]
MIGSLSAGLLGLVVGAKHAFEPDHLAAVCTVVTDPRGARRGHEIGAAWGAGHTAALVVVGAVALALRTELPAWLSSAFELGVAAMLLVLGLRGVVLAARLGKQGSVFTHRHGETEHTHAGPADHIHAAHLTLARRPFLIGMVHGLAGSGALTALAVAASPTVGGGVAYILLFGLGSVAGMALITGAVGASLRRWVRSVRGQSRLGIASGALSVVCGLAWGYEPLLALVAG